MMSNKERYGGVYALMLTPYNDDLSIDWKAYENYVEWQLKQGAHYLFAVCGSSEMAHLSAQERTALAKITAEKAKGSGVGVFASANIEADLSAQVEEVKRMSDLGLDGLVFVTKGYGDAPEKAYSYLTELASHTELPILLYEWPGASPHAIDGATYGKLVQTGRFVGIKDTTCNMPDIQDKIDNAGDSAVMNANISYLLESYKAGAVGVVATPCTAISSLLRKMWDEFMAGDIKAATETHAQIVLIDSSLNCGFNMTAKLMLNLRGVKMNLHSRSGGPLGPADQNIIRVTYDWAKNHGILD